MPTLLQDVAALLKPVSMGRAWYGQMPTSALPSESGAIVQPFVVWQRIVSTDVVDLDGADGLQDIHLQVDIYAPRIDDADRLRRQIDKAFATWPHETIPVSQQDITESAVGLCRIVREYNLSYRETDDVQAYQSTLYAPGVGRIFSGALALDWTHQMVVTGDGALTAEGLVEGTSDATGMSGWTTICVLSAAGSDSAAASPEPPVASHLWLLIRHRLTSVTGTNAIVQVNSTGQ